MNNIHTFEIGTPIFSGRYFYNRPEVSRDSLEDLIEISQVFAARKFIDTWVLKEAKNQSDQMQALFGPAVPSIQYHLTGYLLRGIIDKLSGKEFKKYYGNYQGIYLVSQNGFHLNTCKDSSERLGDNIFRKYSKTLYTIFGGFSALIPTVSSAVSGLATMDILVLAEENRREFSCEIVNSALSSEVLKGIDISQQIATLAEIYALRNPYRGGLPS